MSYKVGDLVIYGHFLPSRIFATRVAPLPVSWKLNAFLSSGVCLRDGDDFEFRTSCGRPAHVRRASYLEVALLSLSEEFL